MPQPSAPISPRQRLLEARLLLVFTPGQPGAELARLEQLLPLVDLVQIRVKGQGRSSGPSPARDLLRWTEMAAERIAGLPSATRPLLFVNDRADVALSLGPLVDGLHLGQNDAPPAAVRAWVGERLLLGLSTHTLGQVAAAQALPVDYLGFGPVFASHTKGYDRGVGPERAQVAAAGSACPVFAIGGIDLERANELAPVGRIAVGSALLQAGDPVAAALALRAALEA